MSTILVNTLTGTSTAGSIAVTGEGNSTTTNLQQGLAKAWYNYNQITDSEADTFNISTINDDAAGKHSGNFSNNFNNATYSQPSETDAYRSRYETSGSGSPNRTTSTSQVILTYNSSGNLTDFYQTNTSMHGDLA